MAVINIADLSVRDPGTAQLILGLGTAFQNAYGQAQKQALEQRKQAAYEGLGGLLQGDNPDYKAAAGRLMAAGDLQGGVGLLGLADKMQDRQVSRDSQKAFNQILGLGGGQTTAPTGQQQSGMTGDAANAIAGIESGGRYDALGPATRNGDRAYGKYQVMGANVGPWTEQYVGRRMTPQEFIASPEAQDAVFRGEFGRLASKHGPEGAARAWFAGEGGMNDPNRKDVLGTSVAQYGQKFAKAYGGGGVMAQRPDVQVANNEADVQRLEAQMPANQMAQAGNVASDAPAQGANAAQFAVPGQQASQGRSAIPPGDPFPGVPTQKLAQALATGGGNEGQRALVQRALDARQKWAMEDAKGTDVQRNYEAARRQGYQGTLLDYQKELRQQTNVNIDQRGETEEAKALGKKAGEAAAATLEAGGKSGATIQRLNRMGMLLDQVETGRLAPAKMTMAQWGKALGVSDETLTSMGLDPKSLGSMEALQGLISQSVTGMIGAGGFPANNFSDADREFLTRMFPALQNTPAGNKLILETLRISAERDRDKARSYSQWKRENKGSFFDFETQWDEQNSKGPDRLAAVKEKASAIVQPQQPAQAKQEFQEGATAYNPQTKQRIIFRNGQWTPMT